jgi:hypothetical protein
MLKLIEINDRERHFVCYELKMNVAPCTKEGGHGEITIGILETT